VSPSSRSFTVQQDEAGERLDRFLVRRCPGLGRRAAASLIERGLVTLGGRRASKASRLAAGDVVDAPLDFGFAPPSEARCDLDVKLERQDLVVVDKPAGQPTAPLAPGEAGTLAGALLARYPEMRGVGYREREPGILHRLDTRTSGLVIAARNTLAFEVLRDALRAHGIHKRYLAIVEGAGLPDEARIELPLSLEPGGSGRVVALTPGTKGATPCLSLMRVLERRGRFALVEVEASRAYRHQVRVHLAASGWPIAGDLEYGGARRDALSGRHALHASHVAWAGDERVPAFAVDSPLPADLAAFLADASGLAGASIRHESS
jgi:23S rRNA pseudouridine1911/1915/1917 synthase